MIAMLGGMSILLGSFGDRGSTAVLEEALGIPKLGSYLHAKYFDSDAPLAVVAPMLQATTSLKVDNRNVQVVISREQLRSTTQPFIAVDKIFLKPNRAFVVARFPAEGLHVRVRLVAKNKRWRVTHSSVYEAGS